MCLSIHNSHSHTHTRSHAHTHAHTRTHTHTLSHSRSHTHTHTHTRTHAVVTVVLETNQVEVSEGVDTVRVCTHLVGAADFDINAQLQTIQSSAIAGLDFTSVTGSLVFPAHSTDSQCLDISIVDDIILEHEEEFLVELSTTEANSLVIAADNNTLTVIIIDNDCE